MAGAPRKRTTFFALRMLCALAISNPATPVLAQGGTTWAPPSGEVREVGLHVRTLGSGSPTIVLLHGLAGSNRYFGADFDALAEGGRVVVPDLLGFGDSPRPDDVDYGPEAHATALIDALEKLGIQPPVYVGAHSAGTLVALRLAVLRPDWVRGIVAFGPPLYHSEAEARAHIAELDGLVRHLAMDSFWAGIACRAFYPFSGVAVRVASRLRPELPREIVEDVMKHSWSSYSGTVRHLVLGGQPPVDLTRLDIPIWLITGTQDEVVRLDVLQELIAKHSA